MSMEILYKKEFTLRFQHCDPAGILFYPKIYELAHETLESFVESHFSSYNIWFSHPEYAVPIVHAEADFKIPMKLNNEITVEVYKTHQGESSLQFEFHFKKTNGDKLLTCALVKSVHCFIDKKTMKKTAIPESIAKKF